jgi:MFS family permease
LSIAPDPVPPRSWFIDLAPLRESPAYMRFWTSGVAAGIGTQLSAVAIGIQVYDISGSTAAVALVGGFALGPMIVMGIFGGAIVDAFDRRRVLIIASSISFGAPIGIATLAWSSVTALWPYYVFTTIASTVGAVVGAARFAIHPRLVPFRLLPAVAALSGLSAGLQSAVGPTLAGVLVATLGYAWTYTIDVGLFLVGFWGIVSLPPIIPAKASRVGVAALRDGFAFLRTASNLRVAIAMQIASISFGRVYAILPAVGALLIGGGAITVGVLAASAAVGVVVSGLASGRVGSVRRHGAGIALASVGLALSIGSFGAIVLGLELAGVDADASKAHVPALVALCLTLMAAGASENIGGIFRTTMMQQATPDEMRGRLQGLYTLVLSAGPRMGDVFAGFVAAAGALWFPPLLGAVLILSIVAALYRARPGFRHYDALEPLP